MTEQAKRTWRCTVCGYAYNEADGAPELGIAPGTRFEDLPDDWYCPYCGATRDSYELEG